METTPYSIELTSRLRRQQVLHSKPGCAGRRLQSSGPTKFTFGEPGWMSPVMDFDEALSLEDARGPIGFGLNLIVANLRGARFHAADPRQIFEDKGRASADLTETTANHTLPTRTPHRVYGSIFRTRISSP